MKYQPLEAPAILSYNYRQISLINSRMLCGSGCSGLHLTDNFMIVQLKLAKQKSPHVALLALDKQANIPNVLLAWVKTKVLFRSFFFDVWREGRCSSLVTWPQRSRKLL